MALLPRLIAVELRVVSMSEDVWPVILRAIDVKKE
jgi:hypothetical protein